MSEYSDEYDSDESVEENEYSDEYDSDESVEESENSDEYDSDESVEESTDYNEVEDIPPEVMEIAQTVPRTANEMILCNMANELGDLLLHLLNDNNNLNFQADSLAATLSEATVVRERSDLELMAVDSDSLREVFDLLHEPEILMDRFMARYCQYSFIIDGMIIQRIYFHKSAKYDDVVEGLTEMIILPNNGSWENKIIELRTIHPKRNLGKIPQNKSFVEAGVTNNSIIKVILVDI